MGAPDASVPDRDPTTTLNYDRLLQVYGTATNAFVNLADGAGLEALRGLLLDSMGLTKNVSAEVLVDGRRILPAFRSCCRRKMRQLLLLT